MIADHLLMIGELVLQNGYEVQWCLKKASEASNIEEKRNYEELADMWANK